MFAMDRLIVSSIPLKSVNISNIIDEKDPLVFGFIRLKVSNKLANSKEDWIKYFQLNHSGRGFGQYIIIDRNSFTLLEQEGYQFNEKDLTDYMKKKLNMVWLYSFYRPIIHII